MKRTLLLATASAAVVLIGFVERVETQATQRAPQGHPTWAWKPVIPTVKPGEIDVLHVKGHASTCWWAPARTSPCTRATKAC